MEDGKNWKSGRLEGWKIGRMEDWKIGKGVRIGDKPFVIRETNLR
jgi:hypothetical protein